MSWLATACGLEIVSDEHERRAGGSVQVEQKVEDSSAGLVVEVAGGLVGEEQRRAGRRRLARSRRAASRRPRVASDSVASGGPGRRRRALAERAPMRPACPRARAAAARSRSPSTTATGETIGKRNRPRGCEARAAVLVERRELRAVQPDFARRRLVEAREQREQRRFAGARRPDDRRGMTARHADRDGI